jgi:hypothetical protein
MQDAQAGATLKGCDFEKSAAPQRIERDFLQHFLECLFLLQGVGRRVVLQTLAQQFDHGANASCRAWRLARVRLWA